MNKKLSNNQINNFIEKYFLEIKRSLESLDKTQIEKVIKILTNAYKNGKTVFILGNGGSASTASHLACDLGKGTLQRIYDNSEKRFRVISLTDNVAVMTAYANDLTFEDIFVQQLRNLIEKEDIVIAISGSGNSKNVIKAVEYSNRCGAKTIGFLGFKDGGKLGKIVHIAVKVNSMQYGPIEDVHSILGHTISALIAKVKNIHDGLPEEINRNKAVPFR